MNREQIEELASLHALGALDGEDLAAWDQLHESNPEARQLGEELLETAAQLLPPAAGISAPPALRGRVMDAVFGKDPMSAANSTGTSDSAAFGWKAWSAAAAIILLALAGTSGVTNLKESIVVRDARPEGQGLFIPLTGFGDFSNVQANVLWDSGQRGWYVQANGLPALPSSHTYRVWAVCADGNLHDCGELPLRSGGSARRFVQPGDLIDSMQGFVVSVEPAGEAGPMPTSTAVLISPGLLRRG
jgi:anti-sigma-K factor RskA